MSRNTSIPFAVLALVTCSVLYAGDVYTGAIPKTAPYASDTRTELERLQDQVDELEFFLDEALYAVKSNKAEINKLKTTMGGNQSFINGLKERISFDASSLTISGTLECTELTTESVISESYTPGVGNIW